MPLLTHSSDPKCFFCSVTSKTPARRVVKIEQKRGTHRLFLLVAWVLLAGYCRAQGSGQYQISGDIKGLPNGTMVYLINGSQRRTIDSATVKNNQFVLRGHLAEPAHMYLHAGRGISSKKLADILLDNRAISIKGGAPDYDSVRVSGSAIDQQWKAWMKEDEQIGYQRSQLKQISQALIVKKDTANALALDKVVVEMQAARVSLLKAYVKRYRDTIVGAALPTLCTLQPSLTGNDYLDMYRTLAPTWQQSAFGKEILSQTAKKGFTQK